MNSFLFSFERGWRKERENTELYENFGILHISKVTLALAISIK